MSPEQLSGEQLDARSDVYSLAIMVYQMSSGRLPFEGDNPQAIMIKRITTNPISLRAVAPSASLPFHEAVMSALSRDPDERPATVERFVTELRAAEVGGI
jgi:serine/threonine-protein kinase